MIRSAAVLACIVSLAACQVSPPEAPPVPAEVVVAEPSPPPPEAEPEPEAPAAPDTLAITEDSRILAVAPTAPVRIDGACPFEGCIYRSWTTSAETTVYSASGDTTSAAFTIPARMVLEADRGFALVTHIGRAIAERPLDLYMVAGESRAIASGDTLLVLDYQGEGFYRVWAGGVLGSIDGYDATPGPRDGPALRHLTEPMQQWWAHITLADGRSGWLWMDRTPSISGADALG